MVLLLHILKYRDAHDLTKFKFHYGATSTLGYTKVECFECRFKFHYGATSTAKAEGIREYTKEFKFHYGATSTFQNLYHQLSN